MGTGKLKADLKTLSKDLGINGQVDFLGMVPDGSNYFKAFISLFCHRQKSPSGWCSSRPWRLVSRSSHQRPVVQVM